MNERSEQNALTKLGSNPLFGIAYRRGPTAWRLAPYPFRASVESAEKLRTWLDAKQAFPAELRIAQVTLLPNGNAHASGASEANRG